MSINERLHTFKLLLSYAILKKIERAMPALGAAQAVEGDRDKRLLEWARSERDRIGLRALAEKLSTDPANLTKILQGKRRFNRRLIAHLTTLRRA
jgi:hypothetical protein